MSGVANTPVVDVSKTIVLGWRIDWTLAGLTLVLTLAQPTAVWMLPTSGVFAVVVTK